MASFHFYLILNHDDISRRSLTNQAEMSDDRRSPLISRPSPTKDFLQDSAGAHDAREDIPVKALD